MPRKNPARGFFAPKIDYHPEIAYNLIMTGTGEHTGTTGSTTATLTRAEQPSPINRQDVIHFRTYINNLQWESGHSTGEHVLSSDPEHLGLIRQLDDNTISAEYSAPRRETDFSEHASAVFTRRATKPDFGLTEFEALGLEPLPDHPAWDFQSLDFNSPASKINIKLVRDETTNRQLFTIQGNIVNDGIYFNLFYDYASGKFLKGSLGTKLGDKTITSEFRNVTNPDQTESDQKMGISALLNTGTVNYLLRAPQAQDLYGIIKDTFPKNPVGLPTLASNQHRIPAFGNHWVNSNLDIHLTQNGNQIPL